MNQGQLAGTTAQMQLAPMSTADLAGMVSSLVNDAVSKLRDELRPGPYIQAFQIGTYA